MKQCNELYCNYPVWSNGKCKLHSMRKRITFKKKKKSENIPDGISLQKLDLAFSRYIRDKSSRDGVVLCYICGEPVPLQESVLMHYFGRGNNYIRYDERNCKAGCVTCNSYKSGNLKKFRQKLEQEYGPNIHDELERKSKKIWKINQKERFILLTQWDK